VHNFFSRREGGRVGASPDLKRTLQMASINRRCRADLEISKHKKPYFIGTFSLCGNLARNRASKKTFRLLPRVAARFVCRAQQRDAALTHKIKWSHCYFFFAVVIGM
jgi:hypothetical protein